MNPNSISHRLFIAALKPADQVPGKRPAAAARSAGAQGEAKPDPAKASSLSELASRRVADWSWSGWQHNTI
ncbi:MAG: hypothetical protein V9H26_18440 [Verrucomicrobiota bacterium]|nr:hypothetical protein [Verrucomicrobiota bacterium]MCC6820140.1 hypothetical protein [Limisphaerales bacterium]